MAVRLLLLVLAVGGLLCLVQLNQICVLRANDSTIPHRLRVLRYKVPYEEVAKGLKFLKENQKKDGTFIGGFGSNVAVVSFAGMAFLGSGSTPEQGMYSTELRRCVQYVKKNADKTGMIQGRDSTHGPMYGHAFATLFLAEVYRRTRQEDLKPIVQRGVNLMAGVQNKKGGWRYRPEIEPVGDASVTSCQLVAAYRARAGGIAVPQKMFDKGTSYLLSCQNDDGGFSYNYLKKMLNENDLNVDKHPFHYGYSQFFTAHVLWYDQSEVFDDWWKPTRTYLLSLQQNDGKWTTDKGLGSIYSTAMACTVLQIPDYRLVRPTPEQVR